MASKLESESWAIKNSQEKSLYHIHVDIQPINKPHICRVADGTVPYNSLGTQYKETKAGESFSKKLISLPIDISVVCGPSSITPDPLSAVLD